MVRILVMTKWDDRQHSTSVDRVVCVADHQTGGLQAGRVPERLVRLILASHGNADVDDVVEAHEATVSERRLHTDNGHYWIPGGLSR
ncbi:hypothetical protein [Halorussus marinus]|uniref:hypothetical protein n=1 Tax=Halorussus marinus TaxID=2505976 RepID=UPI00106E9C49|nr:hypothetical protein [Halorussus marinus]